MIAKTIHSLEKVFFDRSPEPAAWSADVAARGEVYSFQVMLELETMPERGLYRVAVQSELPVEVRQVQSVPVRQAVNYNPDDDFLRKEPGLYPDLLEELDEDRFQLFYGRQTLWVTVRVPEDAVPEEYPIRFEFTRVVWPNRWNPAVVATAEFRLKVEDFALPPQQLLRLEWFHADCLAACYGVPCWSEEHWRIVEAFLRNALRHGINCIYTPLWTPPLDTGLGGERPTCQLLDIEYSPESGYRFDFSRLERYLDLGLACGAERFAMSHFFTQWGAKFTPKIIVREGKCEVKRFGWHVKATDPAYREFLAALMPELLALLRRKGLEKRCFFSISDEPQLEQLDDYRAAVELVKPLLEGFPTLEALSSFEFFQKGLVENPIPSNDHIEPFVGHVRELWTYYCCGQELRVPNRFIAMPSRRNRIMGILAYVYDLTGFLQWGFNFYFSQYSRKVLDPFASTDSDGAFPAGDPFLVYPGRGGEPLDSIRHEVFYDGLQDLRALRLLESKIGREAVLALIGEPLTMKEYPRRDEWLRGVRERVYRELAAKR